MFTATADTSGIDKLISKEQEAKDATDKLGSSWQTERFKGCPNFPKCRNTNDKQAYRRRRAAGPTSS